MRLTFKLVCVLTAVLVAALAMEAALAVRAEESVLSEELQHDALLIGSLFEASLSDSTPDEAARRAERFAVLTDARSPLVQVRWLAGDEAGAGLGEHESDSRSISVPVRVADEPVGVLELAPSAGLASARGQAIIGRSATLVAFLTLASVGTAMILGTWIVGRPVERLAEKVRRVGAGDLSRPLELKGHDELTRLAHGLNDMCDQLARSRDDLNAEVAARIAALEQLRQADRLATVGRLAAGMAHELGTPLNIVSGRARLLLEPDTTPEELRQNAEIIIEQEGRISGIIRQLLDFARRRAPSRSQVELVSCCESTTELMRPIARERGVTLETAGEARPLIVSADRGQLEQVLTNLVDNAIQASARGGVVRLTVSSAWARRPGDSGPEGRWACIDVEDEGEGMTADTKERVFDPFFTTKPVGSGTGLGLAIVHGLVAEHDGWMALDSEMGTGSRFSVYLPLEVS